jgi:TonB-linked SusC/RagA family outer membrane protein
MKYIKTGMIICTMCFFCPALSKAQVLVQEDSTEIKQIPLAFRSVAAKDVLGAVSVIDAQENLRKNYTTYGLDNAEALVGGIYSGVWGLGDVLILVDGAPRDLGFELHSAEIDKITILKGVGAVALYGSRAAKGVVLVTTKRGVAGEKRIDVRINTAANLPVAYPDFLGSAEYMKYYDLARKNDGLDPLYGETQIAQYAAADKNPYLFPDIDYYSSDYLKKASNQTDARVEITGGNERAKFYTTIGYLYNNFLLNVGNAKDNYYNRFNVRGNVDLKLSDYITATADVTTLFTKNRSAHGDFWGQASTMWPNRITPLIPIDLIKTDGDDAQSAANKLLIQNSNHVIDGKYLLGGSILNPTNALSELYAAGYNEVFSRRFQFNLGLNADLSRVLSGLSFNTRFAMDYSNAYNQSFRNQYSTCEPVWSADSTYIESLTVHGKDATDGTQWLGATWQENTTAFSGQFNYVKTLNDAHNINAILLATGYQRTNSGAYHKTGSANVGLHLGYNYLHKYYIDFDGAIVHSARLPEGNRQALSPTLTLGWTLSEEKFLTNSPIVDFLKLTASAGVLNTDLGIDDYYMYLGYYDIYGNSVRGDNPDFTFIKRKEVSVGINASLFKQFITIDANAYKNTMDGFPAQVFTLYPNYMQDGGFVPYVNYGVDKRAGFDFNVNLNKRIGNVDLTLGFVGIYQTSEAVKRVENIADINRDRLTAIGRSLETLWGLESDGFFVDEADIAGHATQTFGEVKPGDIKYKDQNGDGSIDNNDYVTLGKWGSPFSYGINFTAKWKNVTFFALATGSSARLSMKDNTLNWIYGDRKYTPVVRDSWTEETKETATYPRLTTLSGDNNFRVSDFWMYKTSRFNLSKIQISYDFTNLLSREFFVKELGVYASGSNLLYFSKEKKYEQTATGSPQTRMFNIGLKATF